MVTSPRAAAELTLLLDRLLTDPELAPLLNRLTVALQGAARGLGASPYADQLDAAAVEALRTVRATAVSSRAGEVPRAAIPEWIRLSGLNTVVTWTLGLGSTCLHSPSPSRPAPVFAAAWKPGLVVCGQCRHILRLRFQSEDDRTCDHCGRVTADNASIHPSAVMFGALAWSFGVCADCRTGLDALIPDGVTRDHDYWLDE